MKKEKKAKSSLRDLPKHFESPESYLAQEYSRWQTLFEVQPAAIQHFFKLQAQGLADAIIQPLSQARFAFPESVIGEDQNQTMIAVPEEFRDQLVGGLMERLTRKDFSVAIRQKLDELEASPNVGTSLCAGLTRYATSIHMVEYMLPSGRSVTYRTAKGDEIPTIPADNPDEIASAIMAAGDAIAEDAPQNQEEKRGELLVPYVPAARRFFLPQWVAFDDEDRLLVGSMNEAETFIVSMQRYLKILHSAVSLAPYMVADERYQRKRYGILGQLINQGRALARFETREIIATIQRRAGANDLNRGLSLSLPYFDDQDLEIRSLDFDIIPAGRIMFIPGFVVLASRKEQVKVDQDTRLSRSTRKHLLYELQMLEIAFEQSDNHHQPTKQD